MLASGLIMVRHHDRDEAGCRVQLRHQGVEGALIA